MTTTPRLGILMMATNMAQKEQVFNEAILAFDAMFSGTVISASVTTPPVSPTDGDCYIVPTGATGIWAGKTNKLAFAYNGWQFVTAPEQYRVYNVALSEFMKFTTSGGWAVIPVDPPTVLADLTDVNTAGVTDGQLLKYDSGTSKWVPYTLPTVATTLHALSDVNVTEGAGIDGKVLKWNNATSKWVAASEVASTTTLAALTDVDAPTIANGRVAKWNGTSGKLEFVAPASLVILSSLSQVADVTYGSGPTTNDVLTWNGAAWAPSSAALSFSFASMSDGPGTFAGGAGKGLIVDSLETELVYTTLAAWITSSAIVLSSLTNVSSTAPTNGQALVWDSGLSKWKPGTISTGVTSLSALSDATITSPVDGQFLRYDVASTKWKNWSVPINAQTSSYTLVLADSDGVVTFNSGSALNCTVPPNASVAFPVGTVIELGQLASGVLAVVAGSGVTIDAVSGTLAFTSQYQYGRLRKLATNTWSLVIWGVGSGGSGLPIGGTTGQTLIKNSGTDGDASWATKLFVPVGGSTGQILKKDSSTDGATSWRNAPLEPPTGGTTGQMLIKASGVDGDFTWTTPSGGSGVDLPLFEVIRVAPTISTFTNLNIGSDTFAQNTDSASFLVAVAATENVKGIYKSPPSTPYKVRALVQTYLAKGYQRIGVGFYDGSNKIQAIIVDTNNSPTNPPRFTTFSWSNYSTFNAAHGTTTDLCAIPQFVWLSVADDGTNVYFEYSFDGVNWITQYTVAKSSGYLGSGGYTNVGFFLDCVAGTVGQIGGARLLSWDTIGSAP